MKQILTDTANHVFTPVATSAGAVAATGTVTGHDTFDTVIKLLTLVVGVAPAVRQLFKKRK